MIKHRKMIALLLSTALLLSMAGCTQAPAQTTAPSTAAPTNAPTEPPAEELYAAAREALEKASHLTLEVTITTVTDVAGDLFSEKSVQMLTYKDMDTGDGIILCQEDLFFDVHEDEPELEESDSGAFREIWYQGNLYVEMDSTYRCQGPLEQEAALSRYTPAVLLNAGLYGSVTSEAAAGGTAITFAAPSAAESWAVPPEAELLDAAGTALVNAEGILAEMTYTATYQYGPARVTRTVCSRPLDTPRTVTAPANPDTYTPLTHVDALRQNIRALCLLVQSDSATVSCTESLFSQAAGFLRNQSTTTNLHGQDADTKVKIETGVFLMDYTSMEEQRYDLEETYADGQLTTVENGGPPSATSGIGWEDMQLYVTEQMVGEFVDFDYWQDVAQTDLGCALLLEYTLNDDFGSAIQDSICEMLWGDPSFLIALADDYRNGALTGYLSIDKYTGLPVATGYYYEGIHTLEGDEYSLTLQLDQAFETPSLGAWQEITGEMPAETEPENKATPLFYHVTGAEGQEMWLLGTIHVGDARTGFLPEELYQAFAASDALALECNSEAFDKQVEEDDALSEEISGLYFYSDGTTIEGMMEEVEYAQALKLLKATGNYNMNMPYAKPYLWSSSIEQFYLRQGYRLHSDQGVEERLIDWAEELDKEIREVESSLFQIKMLTGFSNELQLEMLRDTLDGDSRDYWESTWELYELWCAGDEEALREELSDEVDTSDWTEEEIAEYEASKHLIEEYNKAMSYDRNDGMLKKAVEYLESGDVVFYAVGLAHLLNDVNGLVDALREAGYTVEPVTYAG